MRLSQNKSRGLGFTLVELLVVIGIIAVLAALLIPMVMRSMRNAQKMRTQADFQTIALALSAYKADFGDIPRPETPDTGAAVLGKALMGAGGTQAPPNYQPPKPYEPGEMVNTGTDQFFVTLRSSTGNNPTGAVSDYYYAAFDDRDGADGPGFRTRPGSRVHGPYVQPGKMKSRGTYLLDQNGGAILYFPARLGVTNVNNPGGTYRAYVDRDPLSKFNADHNFKVFKRLGPPADDNTVVLRRIRLMFGDYDTGGFINNDETAAANEYVLIAPGPDGIFGPAGYEPTTNAAENRKALSGCDDVTNIQ